MFNRAAYSIASFGARLVHAPKKRSKYSNDASTLRLLGYGLKKEEERAEAAPYMMLFALATVLVPAVMVLVNLFKDFTKDKKEELAAIPDLKPIDRYGTKNKKPNEGKREWTGKIRKAGEPDPRDAAAYTGALPSADVANMIDEVSAKFGIDRGIMFAVASIESSFNVGAKASTSTAKGLFQFTQRTWDDLIKRKTFAGFRFTSKDIHNPYKNTTMAAAYLKNIQEKMQSTLGRSPAPADIYLAHFLGLTGANAFLTALTSSPDSLGKDVFAKAASSNKNIFYNNGTPRTLAEIWEALSGKVNRAYAKFSGQTKTQVSSTEVAPAVTATAGAQPAVAMPVKLSKTTATPQGQAPIMLDGAKAFPGSTGSAGARKTANAPGQPQATSSANVPNKPVLYADEDTEKNKSYMRGKSGVLYSVKTL